LQGQRRLCLLHLAFPSHCGRQALRPLYRLCLCLLHEIPCEAKEAAVMEWRRQLESFP
jgi:hypothetical protein